MTATCETCRFRDGSFSLGSGAMFGECRRNAPTRSLVDLVITRQWPHVYFADWCGEHAPHPITERTGG